MPGKNRHRKPKAVDLFNRVYREQLELRDGFAGIAELLEQLAARTQLTEVLAAHVKRLLLEKETMLKVIGANRFMAAALPRRPLPILTEDVTR